jgi:hypothetical protein
MSEWGHQVKPGHGHPLRTLDGPRLPLTVEQTCSGLSSRRYTTSGTQPARIHHGQIAALRRELAKLAFVILFVGAVLGT